MCMCFLLLNLIQIFSTASEEASDHAGYVPPTFANLYFDTNPDAMDGSDIGFEISASRINFFIPSGMPYPVKVNDCIVSVRDDTTTGSHIVEAALAIHYFTDDSTIDGKGNNITYPAATGTADSLARTVLRTSQSFAYSAAGGDSYGVNRLGVISLAIPYQNPNDASCSSPDFVIKKRCR